MGEGEGREGKAIVRTANKREGESDVEGRTGNGKGDIAGGMANVIGLN